MSNPLIPQLYIIMRIRDESILTKLSFIFYVWMFCFIANSREFSLLMPLNFKNGRNYWLPILVPSNQLTYWTWTKRWLWLLESWGTWMRSFLFKKYTVILFAVEKNLALFHWDGLKTNTSRHSHFTGGKCKHFNWKEKFCICI